jgi:hypothetical protein
MYIPIKINKVVGEHAICGSLRLTSRHRGHFSFECAALSPSTILTEAAEQAQL